jgi:diguanylate cyclase
MNQLAKLQRLALGNLNDVPEVVRTRMLATVLQTPLSLGFSSFTILLICTTAAMVTDALWAWAWVVGSATCIAWRLLHPYLCTRLGRPKPLIGIMSTAAATFTIFGLGCAGCVNSNDPALTAMSLSGALGIVAGLATRWAALPRPAIVVMSLTVAPPILVLASRGGANLTAAFAIAFVIVSIAAFTVQNQSNLLGTISGDELHRRIAKTDQLTGLSNRGDLMRYLDEACAAVNAGSREVSRFAVLYLDLDGFKSVNDHYGHATGDEVLRRVAEILRGIVGADQMVARIGGDEFIAVLRNADELTARAVAEEIVGVVCTEHELPSTYRVKIGCSVGISLAPDQGNNPDLLMARADSALYEIKSQGKGQTGMWRTLG